VIQSARACAKKRQKTEGESENEARSLEEGKRVRGLLVCRTLSCLFQRKWRPIVEAK
jgi:hypothetical protein